MSKLNNWFITTFISRYDEYNQDMEDTQLCGKGTGYGCGDGYGEENSEIFGYEPDQGVDYFWGHRGSGDGNGDGSGDGNGDGDGFFNFEDGLGCEYYP